ncbi:MAG: sulfotransferase [Bacteroidota bacterium]|nr:sulfotransferase [Bacteroidota bacterium]
MNQEFDIYFHIGLPKVASTFLQREIFPNLISIEFHPKHKFYEFKRLKGLDLKKKHLFSFEKFRGLEEAVEEIIEYFPEAKFIFLVRRQDQWILSKYKYYIRKHGWKDFEDYFDIENNKGVLRREDLFFSDKIKHIERLSNSKPLVLTYDLLKANPDLFFQRITQYTGTNISSKARQKRILKKAFSEKQLIFLRSFNRIYRYKEVKTQYRFLNILHYRHRQHLLHVVAFFCQFFPDFLIGQRTLIDDMSIFNNIRSYYKEDWKYCIEYSKFMK